jgi:hypothetical protein
MVLGREIARLSPVDRVAASGSVDRGRSGPGPRRPREDRERGDLLPAPDRSGVGSVPCSLMFLMFLMFLTKYDRPNCGAWAPATDSGRSGRPAPASNKHRWHHASIGG